MLNGNKAAFWSLHYNLGSVQFLRPPALDSLFVINWVLVSFALQCDLLEGSYFACVRGGIAFV